MGEVIWNPILPPALLALVVLSGVVFVVARWVRTRSVRASDVLRLIAIGAMVAIAAGPMGRVRRSVPHQSSLQVLIDGSLSMATEDEGGLPRLDALRRHWMSVDVLAELQRGHEISIWRVGDSVSQVQRSTAMQIEPIAEGTALRAGVLRAMDATAPNGSVLLLTDGIETIDAADDWQSLGALAAARSVRIDAVVAGSVTAANDVRVIARAAPPVVYAGQPSTLIVDVICVGVSDELELIVRLKGEEAPVFRERFEASPTQRFEVPVRPQADDGGSAEFVVEVVGAGEETDVENNRRTVIVDVIDDAAKVLVLEGQPYWETSFFVDAMRADPLIDVTSVTALTDDRDVVRWPARVPRDDNDVAPWMNLRKFDVVVLGRGVERWLGADGGAPLHHFVTTQGGALILLRGDPVAGDGDETRELRDVIKALSPVQFGEGVTSGGTLGLTNDGRAAGALHDDAAFQLDRALADLPGVIAATQVDSEKALASVWLRQAPAMTFGDRAAIDEQDPPALAVLNAGAGRTMAVLSDGLWRWAMAPQASSAERAVYAQLWSRLVRWMALGGEFTPGRMLSVTVDPGPHAPGDEIDIEVKSRRALNAGRPNVTVTTPSGAVAQVVLQESNGFTQTWTASVPARTEGVYEFHATGAGADDGASARVAVYEHRRETLDLTPRWEQMRAMADASGGKLWPIDGVEEYLRVLQARDHEVAAESTEWTPLWDRGIVFVVVVGLFGAAWLVDRWERGL